MLATDVNPTTRAALPPFDFGSPFTQTVHRNERAGTEKEVWIAPVTPLATSAARLFTREIAAAGFEAGVYVRLPGARGLTLHTVWWPHRCRASADELVDLGARVANIPRAEKEARARRAAAVAEADAAYAARGRAGAPRLAEIVERAPWQLGRLAGEAAEILKTPLTDSSASRVVELIRVADGTVERVEARLRRIAPRDWRALAAHEDVQSAALEGCRLLSVLDGDRASKRNDSGWGADDTAVGHALSSNASLTEVEAAHALALLHHHRRQLRGELLARLFGQADVTQPSLL